MSTPKPNRFGKRREIINVAGFELTRYGSLQKREREHLLNIRRRLLDHTAMLLELGRQMAQELNMTEQEAWQIIQTGAANAEAEVKVKLLPYIQELNNKLNPEHNALQYTYEAVVLLLMSRLESLKDIAADLEEAFGLTLSKQAITEFDKVTNSDRLTAKNREQVCRQIVDQITEDTFEALLEFVSGEESQWQKPEPDGEVDANDPFPSEVI